MNNYQQNVKKGFDTFFCFHVEDIYVFVAEISNEVSIQTS